MGCLLLTLFGSGLLSDVKSAKDSEAGFAAPEAALL